MDSDSMTDPQKSKSSECQYSVSDHQTVNCQANDLSVRESQILTPQVIKDIEQSLGDVGRE
jgi:hypothetical protein